MKEAAIGEPPAAPLHREQPELPLPVGGVGEAFGGGEHLGVAQGGGGVNIKDITAVLANWGAICSPPCAGDSNTDGAVNFADITSVLSNWNRTCP